MLPFYCQRHRLFVVRSSIDFSQFCPRNRTRPSKYPASVIEACQNHFDATLSVSNNGSYIFNIYSNVIPARSAEIVAQKMLRLYFIVFYFALDLSQLCFMFTVHRSKKYISQHKSERFSVYLHSEDRARINYIHNSTSTNCVYLFYIFHGSF